MFMMKSVLTSVLFLCLCISPNFGFAQDVPARSNKQQAIFTVRGSVYDAEFKQPIAQVNIEVNGGAYTTTNMGGEFRIQVRKGDELVVKHKDFETIYYTIKDNERIKIVVRANETYSKAPRKNPELTFNASIDSAEAYLKTDIEKSLQFITEALTKSRSINNNAEVYEVLGDTYIYWKQYDLAISNYRISLQSIKSNTVALKLGKAYWFNSNYQESIATYQSLSVSDLSNWQRVVLQEGLGDTYFSIQDYQKALKAYNLALDQASKHKIKAKITDLNSKIAQVFSVTDKEKEAEGYFDNAMKLAAEETESRAVEEKVKVADFKNRNQNFSDEIELRKQAIQGIQSIDIDSTIGIESALTVQKQNYKIGNAYYLKKDYNSAKTYLEKSIDEASAKNDLVVAKDAKRKLSEVYSSSGEYNKALETYKEYTDLVEALYIKKEQEIIQAARFSKEIAEKQNRITSLESDRQLSESKYQLTSERNKSQQLIIYSLIGGLLLLLVTAYFMYKYIKQQRLANNLLALKSLRSQMNPHFIFNALNSVNSFIASNDERTANRYLSDFSQLMRSVLENSEADFIPLEKEISLLELYTKLEHFRFQDKFDYKINVSDDVVVSDFLIPPMLLQPYIENAVWHGLRYKTTKGLLAILIENKSETEITITITDNGIGRERSKALKTENQKKHNSQGMSNIKKRVSILNDMYQDKVDVSISDFQSLEDAGTQVVVTLKKD